MGANLTTMISSVMASAVIESAVAMKMSILLSVSVLLTTVVVLMFYDRAYQVIQKVFNAVMLKDNYLIAFTAVLLLSPLLLVILF